MWLHILFLSLIFTYSSCFDYGLDPNHDYLDGPREYDDHAVLCQLNGTFKIELYFNGTLIHCRSPPMTCTVAPHELFSFYRQNVICREPRDNLFYDIRKECTQEYGYKRPHFCNRDHRMCTTFLFFCYSKINFKPTFYFALLIGFLTVGYLLQITFCLIDRYYHTQSYDIPPSKSPLKRSGAHYRKKRDDDTTPLRNRYFPTPETSV
ncbi:hypothetical protein GCK72_022492 [Caenorhabditis remanei]|uniref:Uncharacterized protein n=1 Tax=Caenorhabditis remanei TaxID=31234 RepID=A0A6A5FUI1_CAERE|nr:hypothetical protein GCK72_022492 [Caenorhabditis remanei]KAF1746041.1 hypothetical protein GCK72_022492 [Caenorhabditis remanei]